MTYVCYLFAALIYQVQWGVHGVLYRSESTKTLLNITSAAPALALEVLMLQRGFSVTKLTRELKSFAISRELLFGVT
jgi:hypothetical protein